MSKRCICPECLGKKLIKYDGVNGSNSLFENCDKCKGKGKVLKESLHYDEYVKYMATKGFDQLNLKTN